MLRILVFKIILVFVFANNLSGQNRDLGLKYILDDAGYDGVIALFDLKSTEFFVSHINNSNKQVLPASTFKIFHTLFLLENRAVPDTSYVLEWDGTEYRHLGMKVPRWYKDTSLAEAFRNSTVWYYLKMSEPFSLKYYKKSLRKYKYGEIYTWNKNGLDFWNTGDKMGVSAKDQLKLLTSLQNNSLGFKPEHMEAVRELMVEERTDKYTLRSKTGWTIAKYSPFSNDIHLGWYIGYVEYDDNVYFFAVRIEMPVEGDMKKFAQDRKKVALRALRHKYKLDI